jgi:mannose-6-phosphate isomerase-like protein (cupin superfamily)
MRAWEDVPGRGKVKVAEQAVMVKPGSITYVPWFEPSASP